MDKIMLCNDNKMENLIDNFDWSQTTLGPMKNWNPSLRSITAMVIENRFPMALWWGKDLISIYNDAYVPTLAGKHPAALGRSAAEVWKEIWHILGPQTDLVLNGQGATWNEHLLLPMNRKGFLEETYYTFSYSPVRDDIGAIGGVLVTCQETTAQVQFERQLQMLRDLGTHVSITSDEEACRTSAEVLSKYDIDIPFALFYLMSEDRKTANLIATTGLNGYEGPGKSSSIKLGEETNNWPLYRMKAIGGIHVVDDLEKRLGTMPGSRLNIPPKSAVIIRLTGAGQQTPYGFLIAGVNPLRVLDEQYKEMYRLTADQIVSSIAKAHAYEEERKRAEALAEIDRAKTDFFSNVSHEFRTPLTLILSPLEDMLQKTLSEEARPQIETIHRNALRMLKLVNSLLDFSRIEAGRTQAVYKPTDLATYTAELASTFRSIIEKAEMELVVNCPPLPEPIYVDQEMWEKIVLNLLSNAFKFTFEGRITVGLRWKGDHVELSVEDTGIGISQYEQSRLFERFYRVQDVKSRTFEGTGIGLALIKELVKLHGGFIRVQSNVDCGSTFIVVIPIGSEHLPQDRINADYTVPSTAIGAASYIEEASRWLPETVFNSLSLEQQEESPTKPSTEVLSKDRILLVDDNADMRDYLFRLLGKRWIVEVVPDGQKALEAALSNPPTLILSDVMMPGLNGIDLLRKLRQSPETREIPVILLSARAGEEAKIEGLEKGADDYIVKPFNSRELIAKVGAQIEMRHIRREALQREHELLKESNKLNEIILEARKDKIHALENAMKMKDEFLMTISHEFKTPLNVINAVLQAINMLYSNEISDNVKKHLDKIRKNCFRQLRLVNNLLDITRFNAGHIKMHKQNLDIVFLSKAITESVMIYARQKGVKLDFTSEIEYKEMAIDEEKFERILLNLLSNAIKFTPNGKSINVNVSSKGRKVQISVRDEGVGIPRDKQEYIFERFGQVDNTLTRQAEGTGIGLSLVKALVSAIGGTIELESEVGRGSTFTVILPVTKLRKHISPQKNIQQSDNQIIQAVEIEFSDIYAS